MWDKRESWRGSTVMRSQEGDKVIIKRDSDGHYVYFSVHRDGDSDSIIDFIQRRHRLSLGAVRKELRAWSVMQAPSLPHFSPLPKTGKNRIGVETQFARIPGARRHPYLENERGVPAPLLELPRFAGRIRIDAKGNAVFPKAGFVGIKICSTLGMRFSFAVFSVAVALAASLPLAADEVGGFYSGVYLGADAPRGLNCAIPQWCAICGY